MKIIRDSIIYLIGDLISRSIPFVLLPYLTRTLGSEGFGELSYYQIIIALGLIFVGFSQDGALIRYYYKYGKNGIGSLLLASIIQSTVVCILVVSVVLIVFRDNLFIYSGIAAYTQSILALFFASQQCQRRPVTYIALQFINAVISAGATVILFNLLEPSVSNRIISMVMANSISLICSIFIFYVYQNNGVRSSSNFMRGLVKYNFAYGLPLLLHQLSFFAKGQVDRLLIYKMFSASTLGVYSVGYQLASILAILLMAINKATVPYYYDYIRNGYLTCRKIKKYALLSFLITPLPFVIFLVIPESLYIWVLGPDFGDAKYYSVIFVLSISLTIPYLLLVNYYFYHGKNKVISLCTVSSSLIYIFLVYCFARLDIKYVPYAMLISNLFMVMMLYVNIKKVGDK
ncbi:oligosaccharide flippase family protein [Enterobacter cancerogenus]|uniref:oligosaccharide flippase family protein n=1 Tax=Enterobacter cancerogenus TaxID=69218 RepID=UPI003FA3741F